MTPPPVAGSTGGSTVGGFTGSNAESVNAGVSGLDGRQRATGRGEIIVRAGHRDRALSHLYQQGAARIRLPRTDDPALEAVLINTAGGLTGGDQLDWHISIEDNATARITSAAAEKLYRTQGPVARIHSRLEVGAHARLDWLPQESIAFDRSGLNRQLDVHLHASATALLCESFVLGRQAMTEQLHTIALNDQWRVWRSGSLLHAEALRLNGDMHRIAPRKGLLHDYGAIATVIFVSPAPQEVLQRLAERVSALMPARATATTSKSKDKADTLAACSVLEGRLVVRLLARDGYDLRRYLIPCLTLLSDGRPLPRVWEV